MHVCRYAALLLISLSLTAQQPDFKKEAALGSQMASELRRKTTAIQDSDVQKYLDLIGRRLAAEMPNANFPFTFSVIADDPCRTTHEPASLPGGYVFVPAALFFAARSEAEFAGMLAHSMEHVAERHSTGQSAVTRSASLPNMPLIFIGSWSGSCSGNVAIPRGLLAMQRNNELEADRLAVQTIGRAGFDPSALVSYIQRVQTPQTMSFSSLPDSEERVAEMNLIIERLPAMTYQTSAAFAAIQDKLQRLTTRQ